MMRREFGFTGFGFGSRPAAPSAASAAELHPDPGFANSGTWTLVADNDPPIVNGKLRFDAGEQGTQLATAPIVGGPAPAGNYVLGLDADSITATLTVTLLQVDGSSAGSATFDTAGAAQTAPVTATATFDRIRYSMSAGVAVIDNGSLQAT
jgi:hypothetical protein